MTAIKKTISINEDIVKKATAIAPNFSATVEAALIEYIHKHRVKKAIQSFGKWDNRAESSVDIINSLRSHDDRDHVNVMT
jgi:hypothetical protein